MQQKMMLFTPAVGFIYGLWFFLAPNSYWSVMTVPFRFNFRSCQRSITKYRTCLAGNSLCSHRYQKICNFRKTSEFMMIHAVGWAIFAIGGLYLIFSSGDPIGNNPFFYQALIFLIIGAGFYAKRN